MHGGANVNRFRDLYRCDFLRRLHGCNRLCNANNCRFILQIGLTMLALFETIHSWIGGLAPDQITKKVLNMSNVNYTPEMVKILEQNAPVDYAKAQDLAKQLDRGVRSIIAKCKREGIEYISKPAPAKKKAAATKVELVAAIAKAIDCDTDSLSGLEKSTGIALSNLLMNIS